MKARPAFQKKIKLIINKHFDLNTEKKFVKTFAWSVLTYGHEL